MRTVLFGAADSVKPSTETLVKGERDFTATSTVFIVPAGVYSISVALVGAGQGGYSNRSGNGANLRYRNNIPVVPGQQFTIACGINGGLSSALGLTSNTALSDIVLGANGSPGVTVPSGGITQGGNVGGFSLSSARGAGINLKSWTYVQASSSASNGGVAGGGGGVYNASNPNLAQAYSGARGAVRLIWGPGRSFPDKQTV